MTTVTDGNGAFTISSLNDGMYRIEATLAGFVAVTMEHVPLHAGEIIHASVAMRPDTTVSVIVGGLAPMMTNNSGTTRISRELFDKLPF